jgi:MIP family channel proteins
MADWTTRQLAAEFMATTLFVWIGTGAAVSSNFWTEGGGADPGRLLTIAMAFGVGITVLAYGIGHISGGHINPAVTFAFTVLGKMSPVAGILYMVSQCIGAIFGSFIVWGCTICLTDGCEDGDFAFDGVCAGSLRDSGNYGPAYAIGVNSVSPRLNVGSAFLLELVGTYLLVITVLNSAVSPKSGAGNAAPLAIGFSVLLAHIVLVPFTGCGINPARSLGPMVVDSIGGLGSAAWVRGAWVYYVAPFVGAGCAAATYKFVFEECEEEAEDKAEDEAAA